MNPSAQNQGKTASGWGQTLAFFIGAGLVLYAVTHGLIPRLSAATGHEPVLFWFLAGGLLVFAPMIPVGIILLKREGAIVASSWADRLRLKPLNRGDWLWILGSLVVIGALTAGIQALLGALSDEANLQPPFLAFQPLSPGRYWILAVWLPFWLLNILGEEFLWRGVLLPRQEAAFGRAAWKVNALGWLLFHLAFGWQLMLVLLPILVVLPYVAQRRRNTWVGVITHAGLNGPGFVAVALGWV